MTSSLDEFIQLDRTFHELALEKGAGDDVDLTRLHGWRDALRWTNLLSEYRVILLSEAGSGKTEEVRNAARKLRQEGKPAFFVRIEHVCQDFEDAFEEGSFEGFTTWAASGEEGWLLLDSIDEARLRDPKDFERAIKKLVDYSRRSSSKPILLSPAERLPGGLRQTCCCAGPRFHIVPTRKPPTRTHQLMKRWTLSPKNRHPSEPSRAV